MTDAAFKAEFVGYKFMQTRGGYKVEFFVPAEDRITGAILAENVPSLGQSRWAGIAFLKDVENGNA